MDMSLSKVWETVEDRGVWQAEVYGVAKRWTQLSHWTITTKDYSLHTRISYRVWESLYLIIFLVSICWMNKMKLVVAHLYRTSIIIVLYCRGPAWGTPPMAKVMRKEAWHTQRRDQASGNPLFPSIYPQNQSLPTLLFHALAYTSNFMGAVPHQFSRRRSKRAAPSQ